MKQLDTSNPFTVIAVNSDWHATQTAQLGELMEQGFQPFGDPQWSEAGWYDDATRERVEKKLGLHYKYYEISITPPGKWRDMLTARAIETVPKYHALYKLKATDPEALTYDADTWTKARSVYSDFPATQLNPALEDYASNATDNQGETVTRGNMIDLYERIGTLADVDLMLIREFDTLFSKLAEPVSNW